MDERFDNAAADEACRVETPDGSGDWYEVYSAYFMGHPLDRDYGLTLGEFGYE